MSANHKKAFGSTNQPVHWARFTIIGRTGLFHWITVVEPPLAGSACGRMLFLSSQVAYAADSDELPASEVCQSCVKTGRAS